MLMLEDLTVSRRHLSQCFPAEQNIFQWSLAVYHEAVTRQVLDIIQSGLEGNEIVCLLQWILKVYHGEELLGSEDLGTGWVEVAHCCISLSRYQQRSPALHPQSG